SGDVALPVEFALVPVAAEKHPAFVRRSPRWEARRTRGATRGERERRCLRSKSNPTAGGITMATVEQTPLDMEKLEAFVFRAVDEVGATLNTALVVMGDRLGLYRALSGAGPLTPTELAERTGTAE